MFPARFFAVPVLLLAAFSCRPASAAARVELVLVVEAQTAITAQQEWGRRLSEAGISNVRIRSAKPGDATNIERRGTETAPIYAVTGIITPDNLLVVPGARFRITQTAQLAAWIADLAEQGPAGERPAKTAFGLTAKDFARLHADLAPPLGFKTQGMSRADVIRQVAKGLATPLKADPQQAKPLSQDLVAEDLSTLSRGTALAYVLRSPGLCLVPRGSGSQTILAIVPAQPDMEIWPVGWKPEKRPADIIPTMYEFLNVNVSGVSVTQVLEAVSVRLELPILLDHNALARHGLEPDKVIAQYPSKRITYSIMLRNVLFQAGLKSEVRLDEANHPFLWVTSIKGM